MRNLIMRYDSVKIAGIARRSATSSESVLVTREREWEGQTERAGNESHQSDLRYICPLLVSRLSR